MFAFDDVIGFHVDDSSPAVLLPQEYGPTLTWILFRPSIKHGHSGPGWHIGRLIPLTWVHGRQLHLSLLLG